MLGEEIIWHHCQALVSTRENGTGHLEILLIKTRLENVYYIKKMHCFTLDPSFWHFCRCPYCLYLPDVLQVGDCLAGRHCFVLVFLNIVLQFVNISSVSVNAD